MGENDRRKYFMINLHERMLPTSAGGGGGGGGGVEPATSWSPVGRRIQLSHRGRLFWRVSHPRSVSSLQSSFDSASVVSYVAFVLSLFVPQLVFLQHFLGIFITFFDTIAVLSFVSMFIVLKGHSFCLNIFHFNTLMYKYNENTCYRIRTKAFL